MRNFINIVEARRKKVVRELDGVEDNQKLTGLSVEDAKKALDQNPRGVLMHDMFETNAFITKDSNGSYVFYNPVGDSFEGWDWLSDIEALSDYNIENGSYGNDDPFENWTYIMINVDDDFLFSSDSWEEIWSGKHAVPYASRLITG